jgi:hypothetical protein
MIHNITLQDQKKTGKRQHACQRTHAVASKLAQGASAGGEASTAGNCFSQCSEIRSVLALSTELQLLHLFVTRDFCCPGI